MIHTGFAESEGRTDDCCERFYRARAKSAQGGNSGMRSFTMPVSPVIALTKWVGPRSFEDFGNGACAPFIGGFADPAVRHGRCSARPHVSLSIVLASSPALLRSDRFAHVRGVACT